MNSLNYISNTLHRRTSQSDLNSLEGKPKADNSHATLGDSTEQKLFKVTNIQHQIVPGNDFALSETQSNSYFSIICKILLFIPHTFIYIPIYYLLFVIFYPFLKLYHLISFVFFYIFHSEDLDVYDYTETYPTDNESDSKTENNSNNSDTIQSIPPTSSSSASSSSPALSSEYSYPSKNSISTIIEESMEFDPDENQNDDYFKSPLNSTPIIPQINLSNEGNTNKNINTETSNISNRNSLNDKLLRATIDPNNSPTSTSLTSSKFPQVQPTSSTKPSRKKKKKFIFPKLLFNFNIFDPPNLPRKTLVLDLDETLIHSLSRYNSSTLNKNKGRSIEVKVMGNLPTLYHIYKRPYVEEFLSIVYQWFDLVCFTASIKEYADPVINYLEEQTLSNDIMKKSMKKAKKELPKQIFKQRYYRNSCIFVDGKGYVKDLSVLLNYSTNTNNNNVQSTPRSRSRSSSISSNVSNISKTGSTLLSSSASSTSSKSDYSKIVIIDNSPISYVRHKDNGLMIEGWINDPDDMELMNLLPLLNSLRFVSDVRCILGLKDGQRAFV